MSQVINEIQLDFSRTQSITIPAVQFDNGSRFVRVHLQNNKRSVNVTGTQIVIMAIRHDLEEVIESCRILDANNGIIEFEISEAMTEKQGDVLCQLKLFDNADLLTSQIFKISVNRSLTTGAQVNLMNDIGVVTMDDVVDKLNQLINQLKEKGYMSNI